MSKLTKFIFQYVLPESFYFSDKEPYRCPKCWGVVMTNKFSPHSPKEACCIDIYCKKCGEFLGIEVEGHYHSSFFKGGMWT